MAHSWLPAVVPCSAMQLLSLQHAGPQPWTKVRWYYQQLSLATFSYHSLSVHFTAFIVCSMCLFTFGHRMFPTCGLSRGSVAAHTLQLMGNVSSSHWPTLRQWLWANCHAITEGGWKIPYSTVKPMDWRSHGMNIPDRGRYTNVRTVKMLPWHSMVLKIYMCRFSDLCSW